MLMGTSVRLVTFQFMPMALRLNVKHLFSLCIDVFFESAFVVRVFLLLLLQQTEFERRACV